MELHEILDRAGDHLAVGRAFGTAVERDGTVVVPVALVAGGGGGGQGSDEHAQKGEGAGFGGIVYPLGVYSIREGRVRFVPALDVTRILTALLLVVRAVSTHRAKVRVVTGAPCRRHAPRSRRARGCRRAHPGAKT